MIQSLPVYKDILNQPSALRQSLQYSINEGKGELIRAAKAILNARHVVVASIGASYAASFPFIYRIAQMGINVSLEDASELLHYTTTKYDKDTVFILISRSGDTIEITRLMEPLKKLGGTLIGVTNVVNSKLALGADILLHLNSPADEFIAIQTYSATLLVLELLAHQVSGQLETTDCQNHLDDLLAQFSKSIITFDQISQRWSTKYKPFHPIYLLARGASLASACEGQLLFHEMSWTAATFYTAGNFRHGPWEIVQDGFLGIVFAPNDRTYDLNIRLAYDIACQGGDVYLVSHQISRKLPANVEQIVISKTDPFSSPLLEIIPVQVMIYQWALYKEHQPGLFRASSQITLSEGEPLPTQDP